MLADQLGHRLSVGRESLYRRDVVVAHQAAVAFHIGAQNRGQPSLDVRDVPRGRAIVRTAHRSVFSSSELILFHYQTALPWIRSATGSSRLTGLRSRHPACDLDCSVDVRLRPHKAAHLDHTPDLRTLSRPADPPRHVAPYTEGCSLAAC